MRNVTGGTRKAAIYGIITATCFSVTFALAGHFIVHIFTDDTQMINLVVKLLIVDVFLEFGRVTNLVYGQALKTSGDALFPVILGAIFMYLFAVGGTYFLGIHMGLLAVGAYIAMAGDECARAVGMVLRWKSGKWKSKKSCGIIGCVVKSSVLAVGNIKGEIMYFELKENKPHGTKDDPFSIYHIKNGGRSFQIPVHWHDELEIIYVKVVLLIALALCQKMQFGKGNQYGKR